MDMEKKSLIIGGIIGSIVGLFLLVTSVIVPAVSASNNDIDCLKEKLRRICQSDPKPEYLDCENIFICIRLYFYIIHAT
jgi:hypothetical protein